MADEDTELKLLSPEYVAVIVCDPIARVLIARLAVVPLMVPLPIAVPLS
jgi:hypothetical protein